MVEIKLWFSKEGIGGMLGLCHEGVSIYHYHWEVLVK